MINTLQWLNVSVRFRVRLCVMWFVLMYRAAKGATKASARP